MSWYKDKLRDKDLSTFVIKFYWSVVQGQKRKKIE